jgi:hypothetical protein
LTGISGKKVVASRKTHVSYYVDIEQRISDVAIILYGDNDNLRDELLDKYDVAYFYEGYMLYRQEMRVRSHLADYLKDNGVEIVETRERLDIAAAGAQEFDLAIIVPQELSDDFQNRLELLRSLNKEPPMNFYRIN